MLIRMRQYDCIGSGRRRIGRAALSWLVFVTASAAAGLGAAWLPTVLPTVPPLLGKAVPAAVMLVVTVPLVLLVHRRDRSVLALTSPRSSLVGVAVTLGAAVLVLGPAVLAGWITVSAVDVATLVVFLITNTVLAFALEALPEELTFRGSVYGTLRNLLHPGSAGLLATAAFVVAPGAGIALTAGAGRLLGIATPPATFAPGVRIRSVTASCWPASESCSSWPGKRATRSGPRSGRI